MGITMPAYIKQFANGGLTGFMAGFANTNLRAGDRAMILRIWAVGLSVSGEVQVWVNTGAGPGYANMSFELAPISEGIYVGISEIDLNSLDLPRISAGSYTLYLKLNSMGGVIWWPWEP